MLWGGHCRLRNARRALSCNVGYVRYIAQGYGGMLWRLCRGMHVGYDGMPLSHFGWPFMACPRPPLSEIQWRGVPPVACTQKHEIKLQRAARRTPRGAVRFDFGRT